MIDHLDIVVSDFEQSRPF